LKDHGIDAQITASTINVVPVEKIRQLIQKALKEGVFPGGVLLTSHAGQIVVHEAFGLVDTHDSLPVCQDTVYDLASLTKPLATTLAVVYLSETSRLEIHQSLEDLLPQTRGTDKAGITVEHLLAHRSGLPDYRPYYKELAQQEEVDRDRALRELLIGEPLINPIGEKTVYSDLGFMLLRWVVEHISGVPLNHLVEKGIYEPAGIKDLFFPGIHKVPQGSVFAATEECPWRKELVRGVVHDENAFAVGGVDGQAGLFGTASAVHALLIQIMASYKDRPANSVLPAKTVQAFLNYGRGKNRALGFDRPTRPDSSSGRFFSENSVGHLGFTGGSFWMDLDRDVIVILLTNRIHPTRENEKIKIFRPLIHDAVMGFIL